MIIYIWIGGWGVNDAKYLYVEQQQMDEIDWVLLNISLPHMSATMDGVIVF